MEMKFVRKLRTKSSRGRFFRVSNASTSRHRSMTPQRRFSKCDENRDITNRPSVFNMKGDTDCSPVRVNKRLLNPRPGSVLEEIVLVMAGKMNLPTVPNLLDEGPGLVMANLAASQSRRHSIAGV